MVGWVETRMGPGANERLNGLRALGSIGLVAGAIGPIARAATLAVTRAATFAPALFAGWTIATPLAGIATAWWRTTRPAA
jgi:hypothetical protein